MAIGMQKAGLDEFRSGFLSFGVIAPLGKGPCAEDIGGVDLCHHFALAFVVLRNCLSLAGRPAKQQQ